MPPLLSLEDCARLMYKCKQEGSTTHALHLFAYLLSTGVYAHRLVGGNHLLSLLVLMDCLSQAHILFSRLPCWDENSWNILITGYARCGSSENLLALYREIPEYRLSGLCSSVFVAFLKACIALQNIEIGSELHGHIATMGLHDSDTFIASTLIDLYAKCGMISKAEEVFNKLLAPNTVCCNALITGYVEHGLGMEAIKCFEQMRSEGIHSDAISTIYALKACAMSKLVSRGQELYMDAASWGLERDLRIGSALVDMYTKFSLLADAQKIFDRVLIRDVILWTSLIMGYAEGGESGEAINCYKRMEVEHILPNAVTYACTLKACIDKKVIEQGQRIHMHVEMRGEKDLLISNALVDFYANTDLLTEATNIFNKLGRSRDHVSWNILITAYIEQGHPHEATRYIHCMGEEGVSPDVVTLIMGIKSYASLACFGGGQSLHSGIIKSGLDLDIFVGSALIDCYAKCGLFREAQDVFDGLPFVSIITWTALISGYAEHGFFEQAIACFQCMLQEGFSPVSGTLESCLKACGSLGALGFGYQVHATIARKGWEQEVSITSSLVDSYAKCGAMAEAQAVFDQTFSRNIILWSALIAGYAQVGEMRKVVQVFEMMKLETVEPNPIAAASVLSACSRAGTLDLGQMFFENCSTSEYFLVEHCTCMLDLLSRAGHIQIAVLLIMKMPFQPQRVSWRTIGGVFHRHNNGDG